MEIMPHLPSVLKDSVRKTAVDLKVPVHENVQNYTKHLKDYEEHLFNFSLSNQPITWQLLQCIEGCGPGQDNSKLNVRMEKKGHLSNFERGMVVCAGVFHNLLSYWDSKHL